MTWWEKIIYALALAFWKAYFDVNAAHREAEEEVPDDTDRSRADSFRAAVERLRAQARAP